jgi:hypothetical protein
MWIEVTAAVLMFAMLVVAGFFLWKFFNDKHDDVDQKITQVINKYNDSAAYTYQFDKQQQDNLQKMESNINSMFNNYAAVKNDVLKIKSDYMSKTESDVALRTQDLEASNGVKVGDYIMSEKAPKDIKARADGSNWLFLYGKGPNDGGLSMNKINARSATFTDAQIKKDMSIGGTSKVSGGVIFGDEWIMQNASPGSMRIAPKKKNEEGWDLARQVLVKNTGYVHAEGGGLIVRGGRSAYNPNGLPSEFPANTDDKNYLRGDTRVDGIIETAGPIQSTSETPGPMLERKASAKADDRYGVGLFSNGTLRMYSAGYNGAGSVNLSVARGNDKYDDVITVKTDKTVDIKGTTNMTTGSAFCFPKTCLRETEDGKLQACDKELKECRNI